MTYRSKAEQEIQVLSAILKFIGESGYRDHDDFASALAEAFVQSIDYPNKSNNFFMLKAKKLSTNFFKANTIQREEFLEALDGRLTKMRSKLTQERFTSPLLTFQDLFPEAKKVPNIPAQVTRNALDIPEETVQDALRQALSERGASPLPGSRKDSVIEVADLEHFYMKVNGREYSFSAVVKGYKSVGKAPRISFEKVAHQILKAHRTKPDYILLVTAKELRDDVISEIAMYCADLGKPHLVVFIFPRDLARFLRMRKVI